MSNLQPMPTDAREALLTALYTCNLEQVQASCDSDYDFNVRLPGGKCFLTETLTLPEADLEQYRQCVRAIIASAKIPLDWTWSPNDESLLHVAMTDLPRKSAIILCEELITHGADLSALSVSGLPPLHRLATAIASAPTTNMQPLARLMLEHGADIRQRDTFLDRTALGVLVDAKVTGCSDNTVSVAKLLIDSGCNVDDVDQAGSIYRRVVAKHALFTKLGPLFEERGCTIASDADAQSTQLFHSENAEHAQMLIDVGCNIDAVDAIGNTPLMKHLGVCLSFPTSASSERAAAICTVLLAAGAATHGFDAPRQLTTLQMMAAVPSLKAITSSIAAKQLLRGLEHVSPTLSPL